MNCIFCKRSPIDEPTLILWRINEKGIKGEWLCNRCDHHCTETDDETGKIPVYLHTFNCPGFCNYACNPRGFDQANILKASKP